MFNYLITEYRSKYSVNAWELVLKRIGLTKRKIFEASPWIGEASRRELLNE